MRYHPFRIAIRLTLFMGIVFGSLADSLLRVGSPNKPGQFPARAAWLTRWSSRTIRSFNVRTRYFGQVPEAGLVVSNHLSYLDIVVLASQMPIVFLSKQEVRSWPLIGWCVQCAGTLFINRQRRADVKRVAEEFEPVIQSKVLLAMFPEGTSSDGNQVLPFHSSLLAPAENQNWTVTPVWIGYQVDDGSVEQDVAYWGDMTFGSHFLKLISRREIHATVAYGEPLPKILDRKELARQAQAQVEALRAKYAPSKSGNTQISSK